ncbi:MAG TPA: ROK family protein, partial [Acidobacteriaceae bacterium]|nr:ROK family protein [Acidobacteriaceae bacterium]
TGCGGGIAINGKVHIGPNGVAGEWGHNPLPWARVEEELPGPLCYCGRHGCIETWISGTGLALDHATLHPPDGRRMTGEEIVRAAEMGDAAAEASLARLEDRIGRALASVVNLLDPDAIVIGGGLSKIERIYQNVPPVMERYLFGGGRLATPVLRAKHGDASGVRGAAWLWVPTHVAADAAP